MCMCESACLCVFYVYVGAGWCVCVCVSAFHGSVGVSHVHKCVCVYVYQLCTDGWQSGSCSQMIQYANELLSAVLQEQYTVFLTVGIQPAGNRLHCTHRQGSYLYFHIE